MVQGWKRQQTNKQKPGYCSVIWHISKISLLSGTKGGLKFNNEGSHISTLVLFLYCNFSPLNPLPLLSLLFLFILIPLLFFSFYSINLGQIWKKIPGQDEAKIEEIPIQLVSNIQKAVFNAYIAFYFVVVIAVKESWCLLLKHLQINRKDCIGT